MSTYYSVFVTCLKLMSNVFSVHQRTCLISHTSAYVGAIRRSVTGPLDKSRGMIFHDTIPMKYTLRFFNIRKTAAKIDVCCRLD